MKALLNLLKSWNKKKMPVNIHLSDLYPWVTLDTHLIKWLKPKSKGCTLQVALEKYKLATTFKTEHLLAKIEM